MHTKMTPSNIEGVKAIHYPNDVLFLPGEQDLSEAKEMTMLSTKDAAIVYETLLSAPGMSEPVKIALQIPRKNVLLLVKLMEHGLLLKEEKTEGGVLATLDQPTTNDLQSVAQELLHKAGLSELHERLTALQTK